MSLKTIDIGGGYSNHTHIDTTVDNIVYKINIFRKTVKLFVELKVPKNFSKNSNKKKTNTLQGVFIFYLFCVRPESVLKVWWYPIYVKVRRVSVFSELPTSKSFSSQTSTYKVSKSDKYNTVESTATVSYNFFISFSLLKTYACISIEHYLGANFNFNFFLNNLIL